jgi:hypothetical protein
MERTKSVLKRRTLFYFKAFLSMSEAPDDDVLLGASFFHLLYYCKKDSEPPRNISRGKELLVGSNSNVVYRINKQDISKIERYNLPFKRVLYILERRGFISGGRSSPLAGF